MKIALIGQPNSGKSTIFNHVSGTKAVSSNFPGTTVKFLESSVNIQNSNCECVDLPGIYSLISTDRAEQETMTYLLDKPVDVIINILDASLLARSLELTLQLLDLRIPLVVCLNMMDEADRKGMTIEIEKLTELLGVPVLKTQANVGKGLHRAFQTVLQVSSQPFSGNQFQFNRDVEKVVANLTECLIPVLRSQQNFPAHFVALRLLQNDVFLQSRLADINSNSLEIINKAKKKLKRLHGKPAEEVIDSERHALTLELFEKVTTIQRPKPDFRDRIDHYLMHPYWGYLFLAIIFYGFFYLIFQVGRWFEEPLLKFFNTLQISLLSELAVTGLAAYILEGLIQGLTGGIAIVLPYLFPFLLGLSFLEDVGYLPRVAFFMDTFMHRIGLHGRAIVPFVLGYGCNVPAVMAVRILETPRDRIIASVLATMIPCSARTAIIFGLTAYFLGPLAAIGIYVLNVIVIAVTGKILAGLMPEMSPGLILEIPVFRLPSLKVLLLKTWLRLREFIVIAWPILIFGSIVLSVISYFHYDHWINTIFSPLTYALGLPVAVGTTLIFGILRKELSLILLLQVLDTVHVNEALSAIQILVFTIFVVFYFPCLSTLGALIKEIGLRWAARTVLLTSVIAFILAVLARGVLEFIHSLM